MIPFQRIHIMGAPGAGVSSVGKALAAHTGFPFFDTDDFYWFTEDALPYRRKRNPEHRLRLLRAALDNAGPAWVLSGSLCGWGDALIPDFQVVINCWAPAETRLARIEQRETARYGADRLQPGGDLQVVFDKFKTWAAQFDDESGNIRSRAAERAWLAGLACPVLDLDTSAFTVVQQADQLVTRLAVFAV